MSKLLILGGTEEARELAERLDERGADFTVSLAGRTSADYPGTVRRGGFGGEEALTAYLKAEEVEVLVDASHPFAATISPAAKRAARAAGVRYFRLERPPWRRALGDRWIDVRTLEEAAERIDEGSRVFLTVGAGGLAPFLARRDLELVARTIEVPDLGSRKDVVVIRERGPFDIEHERAIFDRFRFDAMVTKNAGGEATAAKLVAARERRLVVYMVQRPRGQPHANARDVDTMMRRLRHYL
ncbi:cobalt-precorrin-6A reductase [Acuticoccus mangrovi]|uniref:Cobalt-precorrin-6A reductase n=1 Tax=Acuticoccus mangrovi TaxID=2796142 RepID=A0A934MEB7_9HYPH|nr:cobalt-precorrin-6A reductase [Acuticoccus mangrovi]MBJ3777312.1 cobalt-precorrin-6A reductase [Acuticoccus mangrovi]